MNFLAHLYLSPPNNEIILGNFIADSVKGKVFDTYSEEIQRGILLHRQIDQFTDQHPVFKQSCTRLDLKYRRYSGVIVDIYYDHFLAKYWDDFHEKDLKEFVSEAYQLLIHNFKLLPPRSKRILPFMITQNWLANYSNFKHLNRVFKGMSRRTTNNSRMDEAVDELKKDYAAFEDEFRRFFPDIIAFIQSSEYY
jgi:acyl carrier protein phosphodiesterase